MDESKTAAAGFLKPPAFLLESDTWQARFLKEILLEAGYPVKTKRKFQEIDQHVQMAGRGPELLMVDFDSPEFRNEPVGAINELFKQAHQKNIAILITYGDPIDMPLFRENVDVYLKKPFDRNKVLAAVTEAFEKRSHVGVAELERPGFSKQESASDVRKGPSDAVTVKKLEATLVEDHTGKGDRPETTDDDWKPVLSFRTWFLMEIGFGVLCLIILAITFFLGPGKVPISFVCVTALWMLALAVHAIYEWWHWVST